MRIYVNAATAVVGGAIQVAVGLIQNTTDDSSKDEFYYAISGSIAEELRAMNWQVPENVMVLNNSPAKIVSGRKSRSRIKASVQMFNPHVIYSIASPSYLKFNGHIEVARFTDPWLTHPNRHAYSTLKYFQRISYWMRVKYKKYALRRVKYYVTQSEVAAIGIVRKLKVERSNVKVIPNDYNPIFFCEKDINRSNPNVKKWKIFVLGYPYPHKHFEIVPQVAKQLSLKGQNFHIYITLPSSAPRSMSIKKHANRLGVDTKITYLDKLSLEECRDYYTKSDILFMPTLLETFSATYLEAMAMKIPIVTSNLNFASDVCGDSAIYYEPKSVRDATNKIVSLIDDPELYNKCAINGSRRLEAFNKNIDYYKITKEFLEYIYEQNKGVKGKSSLLSDSGPIFKSKKVSDN
jgi:glycosyltransferase involved in cell wall biosynthesis